MSARPPATEPPLLRRLFPDSGTVSTGQLLDGLDPVAAAGHDRPYVLVNFVASADGRTAVSGRSAPLSSAGDRAMFHELRERVDAVLAGTRTMGQEGYGRLVRDPARRGRRAARGLAPDPLACLVTRTGQVPRDIPLFADPHSRVAIFTPRPLELGAPRAHIDTIILDRGELTLTTALRRLRADYGVRALLCEGGATLFSGLLHEGLLDELFLTISPQLTGGGAEPTLTTGPELAQPLDLQLMWAVEADGTLFLRYRRG